MDKQWELLTLKEVCARGGGDIQTGPFGSQLHAEDYVKDGIPSVMPQNIGDNRIIEDGIARISSEDAQRLSRYLLREGDVVYSRRGDIERRALVRSYEDGWLCGTGCLRVRFGNDVVVPEYAAFYLATHDSRKWLKNHAVGATMPNLNTSILGSLPFILPPLPVQRQIADILSAFDDKIELNRQMNRTLEQMARALFKSWFIDFDPVHAKQRGEQPEGMDAETAALFPDRFMEIDGKEVPEGWQIIKFSDIAIINKATLRKDESLDKIRYVEISAVSKGTISEIINYSRGEEPSRARRRLSYGDTVLSTVRPDRKAYFLNLTSDDSLIASTGFAVFSPIRLDEWPFIFSGLTQDEVFSTLGSLADGGAYPSVNPEMIGNLPLFYPNNSKILKTFTELCKELLDLSEEKRREAVLLAEIRDLLLPRLLSGELDVSDWENAVEAPEGAPA
ncbi:restriction endonuclease subunit S [Deinococcus sp. 14RED07]|uniref:restriction endonuclease subunit S n=1 Tax=unclassified Deinococcus TaxID=2623546 RepID=UPI001E5791FB|nr:MULTISPECIES: restriction endonuclease subunit S [unclassified Deinococcus]MCD0164101.1 restriction endonuclease subunit S [Deinococcus sp. 12RED42]MCD0174557.1 restriction endonuclease subunit S [Deinococcus sp. 14RED07]